MLKFVKIIMVVIGRWILSAPAIGQTPDTASFFPYQTSDFWVYEEYSQVKQEIVNEIKYSVYADSSDDSGTRWRYIEIDDNSRLDSVYYKVTPNGDIYSNEYYDVELKVLKYAETGFYDPFWIGGFIGEDSKGKEHYARFTLHATDEIPFFGEIREQRVISITATEDTSCVNCGMQYKEDVWVEDFGISFSGGYHGDNLWYLKGAWKSGEVYGDTTFNQIVVDTLRAEFFPYETGDFWVYDLIRDFGNLPTEKVKYRVYADSVDADNTKWVHVEKNVNGAIDSVYYKVMANGDVYSDDLVGEEMLKFKFKGASKGDYWVGGEVENGMYGVYELKTVGIYDVSNTPQSVSENRSIYYYEMPDSTCCNNRIFRESWVAGFGIMGINFFDDPDVEAWSFAGVYKNGQVYGDTTFSVITSSEHGTILPSAFKLRQNYPNPFNPSTTVEYEISKPVEGLSATLYTYTGQKIAELFREKYHSPGTYSVIVDEQILGSTASSMLLLTLKSNTEVQHLKMIYLK